MRNCLAKWGWPLALVLSACSQERATEAPQPESEILSVYAVNYPLAYFAERIGGQWVEVRFPAPAGVDPAFWSPDPEVVAAYQGADLILLNGAGYAKWVERASLPRNAQVDTSAAFRENLIPLKESVTHSHGPEGGHSHKGVAFTTWLDPRLALEQAKAIRGAFAKARPAREADFGDGLERLEADLLALDERLTAAADRIGDEPLLFSHPVYQYLERRYGLNGHSVHWEPDEPPSEDMWRELQELLSTHPAKWMLWEDEPLPETAQRLEATGVRALVYAPCANAPHEGDFLSIMRNNVARLEELSTRR
jgi:zinc transport system substrate-binding protein